MICVGISCVIGIYVVIVVPFILKVQEDIETYNIKII